MEGAIISTVETCVGIFSACLPTYRSLVVRFRPRGYTTANPTGESEDTRKGDGIRMTTQVKRTWQPIEEVQDGNSQEALYTVDVQRVPEAYSK